MGVCEPAINAMDHAMSTTAGVRGVDNGGCRGCRSRRGQPVSQSMMLRPGMLGSVADLRPVHAGPNS